MQAYHGRAVGLRLFVACSDSLSGRTSPSASRAAGHIVRTGPISRDTLIFCFYQSLVGSANALGPRRGLTVMLGRCTSPVQPTSSPASRRQDVQYACCRSCIDDEEPSSDPLDWGG